MEMTSWWKYRGIIWALTLRDIRGRYAGSALGVAWAYLQPLLVVASYILVFDIVFSLRAQSSGGSVRLGAYLIAGALPWLTFTEGLSRGASSLVEAGSLLQKNNLPVGIFVLRTVLSAVVVYAPLLIVVAMGFAITLGTYANWAWMALPLLLLLHFTLIFVLAYTGALLAAASRDILQLLTFSLAVGIYLSPVLFPIELFPQQWRWVLYLNPMTGLVLGYQDLMLGGHWPATATWLASVGWIACGGGLLTWLLRNSKEQIRDWL